MIDFILTSPLFRIVGRAFFFILLFLFLSRNVRKRKIENESTVQTVLRTLLFFIFFLLLCDEFEALKPFIAQLIASSGLIAVVVGIAAQETLGNVFSGLMILFTKPYVVGDLVKINQGELVGYVEEIRFRDTVIRTYESNRILVPNSKMNSATIENADWKERRKDNYLEIPVSYTVPVQKAICIILECVAKEIGVEKLGEMPEVKTIRFENMDYVLRVILPSADSLEGFDFCCKVRYEILSAFQEQGLSFGDIFIQSENI